MRGVSSAEMIISSDKLIVRGSFVFYSTFKINIYLGLKEFCSKKFFSQKNFGSKLYLVSKFYFWFSVKCISRSNTFLSQILFFWKILLVKILFGSTNFWGWAQKWRYKEYQPGSAGGTRSMPAMLHCLQNPKWQTGSGKCPSLQFCRHNYDLLLSSNVMPV